ncbi:MAG TPA: glycosyltransferase family 2 protein [Thermoanaerobaculia bacterium]|nr:glycosyltransferase family 2 protein [Thermoanaerobaculia bacterium]
MANVVFEARHEPLPHRETRPLDLSILIVTWNSERWIDRCLRAIPAACAGLEYEVLVHDNASKDTTVTRLRDVQVLRSAYNAGFAAGTNRAYSASRGRYVFLLNPDCELAPGALTMLFECLEKHPNVAAAAPLLIDESGDSQREFQLRRLPSLATLTAEVLLLDKLFPKNSTTARYRYRDLDLTEPRRIEQPAAAALLIRKSVIEEIGPLDEQFSPAWFEDVDYCRRLAEAKKEVWVVPAAQARHFGGASLEHIRFAGFVDVWYRNMWRYARKWLRPAQTEALRWVIIAGMLLRCAAGLVGLKPRGVQRWEAFRAYANVLRKAFDRWSADSSPSSS